MDDAEMAPLTASCDAATGPKLPVPVDEIVVQVTPPLPFALNGKVLPLNTLNPPLFVARKPPLFAVMPVEDITFALTLLAETADVEMPFEKVPVPSNVDRPEQYKSVKLPVPPVKLVPSKVPVGPVGPGTELVNPSRPVGPVWPVGPATVLADPSRPVGPVWPLVAAAAAAEAAAAAAAATATATAAD